MADFGQVDSSGPINPWTAYYQSGEASNRIIGAQLANQLAASTLDAHTQIAKNAAEGGSLSNELASQKNPLELIGIRQQLGIDPSPTLEKLQGIYSGTPVGPGADASPAGSTGRFAPGTPFVPKNLPEGVTPDEDAMVRTVYGESSGQPLAGQIGVASVIKNRSNSAGVSPQAIVFSPQQFSPWNGGDARARLEAMDPASPQYQEILNNVVRPVLAGKVGDPTKGATHFYAPAGMASGAPPSWAVGQTPTAVIGGHQFYGLGYGPADTQVAVNPPGFSAPASNPAAPGAAGPTPLPDDHNHDHAISVSGGLMQAILDAPPEQRAELWTKYRPIMLQAGALNAPVDYPGDQVADAMRQAAFDPAARTRVIGAIRAPTATAPGSVQVAGPGAPTAAASTTADATSMGAGPAPPAAPVAVPAAPAAPPVAAVAAPPPIPNENPMLAAAAPPGSAAPPLNALLPPAAPARPVAAVQAAPQSGTGMNSPQVQQAQDLLRRAAQIEMAAAQTPNDPRAKATAAAMATDLKARAAVLMQADSVTVDPVTGIGTHTLTGKQESAAVPAMNYQPDPNNPGVLVSPGAKPVVLPPGRATILPDKSVAITGPGGTFKTVVNPDPAGISVAETAAAGGRAAADAAAKTKEALIPLARTAGQAIGNIDYGLAQLDAAAKAGIPSGYFAPGVATMAAAAKYLGINTKPLNVDPSAVSDIQTASKTLAVVSGAILQNIIGKGEITEGKIEAFIHAQPGIVNDPLATHRILNWARSQFVYDHEMAMDGLAHVNRESGQLPPGWQAGYITTHGAAPIYDPVSGEMKQPDGRTQPREPPREAAAPAAIPSRPSGVPDGSAYSPSRHQWRAPDGTLYPGGQQ